MRLDGLVKEVACDIEPWKTLGDGHFRLTAAVSNLRNEPSQFEGQ